jgi:nanoRNase/pAp phosphatase (c-di-AMP/oligoRNAs hydrolase)
MKIKVLFHSFGNGKHCPDGFAAAYAAWKHFGDTAEYIPCVYQDAPPQIDQGDQVYLLDFSYPREVLLDINSRAHVRVLDHHKSAQENLEGLSFACFDMSKSGAELAWEYFHPEITLPDLIRYVADRDLWKKDLPHTEEVHRALQSFAQDFLVWDVLCNITNYVEFMHRIGEPLYQKHLEAVDEVVQSMRFRIFKKRVVAVTNTTNYSVVSDALNELCKLSKCAFALNYSDAGDGKIKMELRSIGDFDVSAIAKQFGGGGHKNAAGCTVENNDERIQALLS